MNVASVLRKVRGFTLIELVIVIVIISILAIVSVPLYRGYTRRAMASEGRALLGAIAHSEKVYLAERGSYLSLASVDNNSTLDIDARTNKYFRTFAITAAGAISTTNATFTAYTTGTGDAAGITVTFLQPYNGQPTVSDGGL